MERLHQRPLCPIGNVAHAFRPHSGAPCTWTSAPMSVQIRHDRERRRPGVVGRLDERRQARANTLTRPGSLLNSMTVMPWSSISRRMEFESQKRTTPGTR